MSFSNFITDNVAKKLREKNQEIANLCTGAQGAWEVWLQIELRFFNVGTRQLGNFAREVAYPGGGGVADFRFTLGQSDINYYAEAKVQLNGNSNHTIDRFLADCEKLDDLPNESIGGAFAIIGVNMDTVIAKTKTDGGDYRGKIRVTSVPTNPIHQIHTEPLNNINNDVQFHNGFIIVWYVK